MAPVAAWRQVKFSLLPSRGPRCVEHYSTIPLCGPLSVLIETCIQPQMLVRVPLVMMGGVLLCWCPT